MKIFSLFRCTQIKNLVKRKHLLLAVCISVFCFIIAAGVVTSLFVPDRLTAADCSVFDGDQSTCQATSGCTYDSASCSAFNGNMGSCQGASGCTYPGNAGSCSTFNGNYSTCVSTIGCESLGNSCGSQANITDCNNAGGCSPNNGNDCNGLSDGGFDGTNCATQPQCSYDSESGVCSGSYFSSCDGDNSTCTGNYDDGACTGTYYLGTCSGTYDSTAPTLVSAVVDGSTLTLTYDETLAGTTPQNNAFSVTEDGTGVNVLENQVSVSGTTVVLTLESTVHNGTSVTISYTAGGAPIEDGAGNDAANLSSQGVTNNTADTFAPTFSTARITGTALTLTYNETLNSGSIPATSAFSVTAAGVAQTVSSVNVTGATVVLTLSATTTNNTVILISYTAGASPIEDSAGNNAANLSGGIVIRRNTDAWTERTGAGSRAWSSVTSSSDGTKLAASAVNSYIYTSTDSGATWSTQSNSSGSRVWTGITSSSDGSKLAAGVSSSYIYTSTDSGATWSTQSNSSGARAWYGITSSSDGAKIAAGTTNSYIYTSTDSGATWTERTGVGARTWYGITSSSDGTKLAAGAYSGYIYTSTDSGATWSTQSNSSGQNSWHRITSSSDGTKLAVSVYGGYIYTSTDSGATWTERTGAGSRYWYTITSSSDGTKLAAVDGLSGYIYTSSDSGITWTERTGAGSRDWRSITSSSDGAKLAAVVTNGYIYTTTLDYTAPTITSISSDKVAGSYTVGEVIDIDVTFSEAVTSTGNVTVTLETGATDRTCTFTASNAATGTCNYTVQAGDTSSDLDATISGTITDAAGNAMSSYTPVTGLAANEALVINTTPASSGGRGTLYNNGQTGTSTAWETYLASLNSATTSATSTNQATTTISIETRNPLCPVGFTCTPIVPGSLLKSDSPNNHSGLNKYIFVKNLIIGDEGLDVLRLQKFLNNQGFTVSETGAGSVGRETRTFGSKTKTALQKFQKEFDISPTSGFFGPLTRALVNAGWWR